MSREDKNKKGKNSTTTVTWDAARPITIKLRTFRFKKFKFRILIHFKLKTIKNNNDSNLRMFTWINCKMHFFTVMETWAHIIPRLVYISPWQTRFLCILIFSPTKTYIDKNTRWSCEDHIICSNKLRVHFSWSTTPKLNNCFLFSS